MFVFASLCVFFLIFLSHCFMKCVIQVSAGMYLCPHFLLIDRPSCDFFFFVLVDFWCESAFVSLANSNLCLWRIPYSFFLSTFPILHTVLLQCVDLTLCARMIDIKLLSIRVVLVRGRGDA